MAINKEKSINYMLGLVVFCIALAIINKFAFNFWRFDIFNPKHYVYFAKYILSGKILHSPKYISFLIVLSGMITVSYFAISESLKFDFSKYFQNDEKITQKPEHTEEKTTPAENQPSIEKKEEEIAPSKPQLDEKISRYNIYNTPERVQDTTIVNETIPQPEPKEEINISVDEEKEREKLQSKIKEIMERLKNKNESDNETEEKPEIKTPEQKILTPMQFDEAKSNTEMNFKNISTEQNNMMEGILVGAGFKLLSEIRIGQTGIDYLGVSKDGISIIQLDTTNGNWMASEDDVGNIMPVWFSEDKQKISPVARAIEAKETIKNLIKGKVDLPVKAYACLANSSVINYFDISDKWDEAGIDVLRLPSNTTIDDIETLDEKFKIGSQKEIDEATMNNLIEILEKAELPE